ncbi:MAG: 3-oxoacyl-[acyl-carrier-protein] reductase [Candidatus Marinimicrobia bacterium]|jgi:3-oxoacyl-[acyl-carrier protein] reductase|nr:3-oxoacyl-[acyl-carrier-protein] reductase [Candidatus Neomarinimicrobiota bacterium]MDD5231340.1 3-oxoacyl-[acyl-carrier-protein] reductase [Candidatus Neomarinimicrobiota bacterium]MDD5540654.1 3-oxoacyl-[acyl-carrier-protein] reductase [Candidatus Neomarinimicrobiota bacterium]
MGLNFKDKVVVITGSGRGIGLTIAQTFAANGATVVLSDYNQESLAEAIALFNENKFKIDAIPCNVTDSSEVQNLIDSVIQKHARIDVLINNAGITRDTLLLRMKEEQWDAVIDTNLKGVFLVSRAAARYFLKQQYGKIINISSVVGMIGNIGQSNYAASKAGVIGFSKTLARELAARNVTVNIIAPGFIDTAMTAALPDEVRAGFIKNIPLNRMGTPQEVANAALFLASPLADYITGQVLRVDGGMVM